MVNTLNIAQTKRNPALGNPESHVVACWVRPNKKMCKARPGINPFDIDHRIKIGLHFL